MRVKLFCIFLLLIAPFLKAQATELTEHQINVLNAYFQTVYPTFGTDWAKIMLYTWPSADGTDGQVLKTNGEGVLAWTNAGGDTLWSSIGNAAADKTIALAGWKTIFSSTLNTAGANWTMTNTTAELTADVSFIDFKYTADGDANGFFLRGYDNVSDLKWSIGNEGAATFGAATLASAAITGTAAAGKVESDEIEGAVIYDSTNNDIYLGTVVTLVKTIGLDDSGLDYELPGAANTNRYDLELTNLLPAYAELRSIQIRCTEAVIDGDGAKTMTIRIGTAANGEQILADATPDTLNEIAQNRTGLDATNANRTIHMAFTPAVNWSTLTGGAYVIAITYVDYGRVYTDKL